MSPLQRHVDELSGLIARVLMRPDLDSDRLRLLIKSAMVSAADLAFETAAQHLDAHARGWQHAANKAANAVSSGENLRAELEAKALHLREMKSTARPSQHTALTIEESAEHVLARLR